MFSWWFPRFLSFVKQVQVTVAWLDSWLARLVLHCMNFELWPRLGYTFTLWCMQGNQAPQYVSHLIKNCHFFFFTYCMSTIRQRKELSYNCPGICLLMSSVWTGKSWTTTLGGMCPSSACKEHSVELTVHCTTHAGWSDILYMSYEAFHHSSSPFHSFIPPFHSTECKHPRDYLSLVESPTQPIRRDWNGEQLN